MHVKVGSDGHKNCQITVSGILQSDLDVRPILLFSALQPPPRSIRLDGVLFELEEKMGLYLWWMYESLPPTFILPLESRGQLNFEGMQGLHSPQGCIGLGLSTFKVDTPKGMLLMIDMVKQ